ncbi:hypothetical protein [Thermopirellula anaerolimosa]
MLVSDPGQLGTLVDAVHDVWFDVDALKGRFSGGVVTIPLYEHVAALSRKRAPIATLVVRHVDSLAVEDTEHVGYYDIDEIRFDPVSKILTIIGCIPIVVRLHVGKLHVEFHPQRKENDTRT